MPRNTGFDRFEREFTEALENGLNIAGPEIVGVVRDILTVATDGGVEGRLYESISFATNTIKGRGEESVKQPDTPLTLKVGSACPYAAAVEYGTDANTGTGSLTGGTLVDNITKWGKAKGLSDEQIGGLIYHIKTRGTRRHPYLGPSYEIAKMIVRDRVLESVNKMLRTKKVNRTVVEIDIPITGSRG